MALFAERAAAGRGPGSRRTTTPWPLVEEVCRSLDGLPLAIELAAARVRSLSVRRSPVASMTASASCATRAADGPTVAGPCRRHRLELRPALPRRPAGPVGAVAVRRRGALDAVEHVLAPSESRRRGLDVIGRLVDRSLVASRRPGGRAPLPAARQHPGLRRRAPVDGGGEEAARAAHAAWFAPSPTGATASGGPARAWLSPGPSGPTSTRRWRGQPTHDPALGLRIAVGIGWAWVVLGDGMAGAARVRQASSRRGAPVAERARATCSRLARGLGRRRDGTGRPRRRGRAGAGRCARPATPTWNATGRSCHPAGAARRRAGRDATALARYRPLGRCGKAAATCWPPSARICSATGAAPAPPRRRSSC